MSARVAVDHDALLCALVLAPATFARNRFFSLYSEPWARRMRSRAAQLRTIVRHLSAHAPVAEVREISQLADGDSVIRYSVPNLHFHRTATLTPLELAAVRFALSRRPRASSDDQRGAMESTEADRRMVEESLLKLGKKLGLSVEVQDPSPSHPTTSSGES